jgi:hypothetical protein
MTVSDRNNSGMTQSPIVITVECLSIVLYNNWNDSYCNNSGMTQYRIVLTGMTQYRIVINKE